MPGSLRNPTSDYQPIGPVIQCSGGWCHADQGLQWLGIFRAASEVLRIPYVPENLIQVRCLLNMHTGHCIISWSGNHFKQQIYQQRLQYGKKLNQLILQRTLIFVQKQKQEDGDVHVAWRLSVFFPSMSEVLIRELQMIISEKVEYTDLESANKVHQLYVI